MYLFFKRKIIIYYQFIRFSFFVIGILCLFLNSCSRRQTSPPNWTTIRTGFKTDLHSVYFVDAQYGWVVGDSGTILFSSDGGKTFSHQISPTEYDLVKVAFFDRKKGIILGKKLYRKNGIILNTVDGGLTWKTVNEDVDQMNDMVLFPNGEVLAVGLRGNIAYSNSSGRTWKNIRYSDSYNFQSVARKGDKSIAFGGDNGVLMYTEGTDIYSQQLSAKSIPQILHDASIKGLHFFSDMSGICIQYESMPPQATIKITDDGGKIWENTIMPINDIKALFSFSFIDSQTGYACGGSHFNFFDPNPFNAGALIKTIDGGRNWSTVDYGDFVELGGVFFLSKNDGWIVGRNGFISCFHR